MRTHQVNRLVRFSVKEDSMRTWFNKLGNDILAIGLFFVMTGLLRKYVTNEPIMTATEMWQAGLVWSVLGIILIIFTTRKEN